jgi:hypothetical protein
VIGANPGTHRFQRAVSAGGALGSNGPSNRNYTLEAMRTQGSLPDLSTCFELDANYFVSFQTTSTFARSRAVCAANVHRVIC